MREAVAAPATPLRRPGRRSGIHVACVCAAAALGLLTSGCASEQARHGTPSDRAETTSSAAATTVASDLGGYPVTTVASDLGGYPVTTVAPDLGGYPATTVAPDSTSAPLIGLQWTADEKALEPIATITGNLAPKSVVASGTGLYFAQNMMYKHTISVFGPDKQLLDTLPDRVDLRSFGYEAPVGVHNGSPVEAAFNSDGSYAFVSNYRMYGPGYAPNAGGDNCDKGRGQDSFVYRIDTRTLEIDRLYPVGPVPKFLAVTPDDRLLLVSNWCGFDVSVIDLQTHEILTEVEVGRHPRGIAITADSATAYVAVMGSSKIAVLDLSAVSASIVQPEGSDQAIVPSLLRDVGRSPRHLVLSPDDKILYVTLNGDDAVVAVDTVTGEVLQRAHTGRQPRSMDISDDGTALYVVNYESDTMTKLRTSDFVELQSFETADKPIGITYDSFSDEVWVSAYSGVIHVYSEMEPIPPGTCTAFGCNLESVNVGQALTSPSLELSSQSLTPFQAL